MNIRNALESLSIAGLISIVYNPNDDSETYVINNHTVKYSNGKIISEHPMQDIENWVLELENQSVGC